MFTAREYGAALFGNLFLCWFAKNANESDVRRAIIIALFVYDLIGFIATTITVIAGVLNPLSWLVVGLLSRYDRDSSQTIPDTLLIKSKIICSFSTPSFSLFSLSFSCQLQIDRS